MTFNRNFGRATTRPADAGATLRTHRRASTRSRTRLASWGVSRTTATITPTVLNHFAIGYNRFGNLNQSAFVDQGWPEKIGLQNVPGTHFPTLQFAGLPYQGGGIGAGGRLGSANAGGEYNGSTIFADDLTIVRGKHNFRVGFEHRRYYTNAFGRGNGVGQLQLLAEPDRASGLPEPDRTFVCQLPDGGGSEHEPERHRFLSSAAGGETSALTSRTTGRLSRKLTLNFGLRWEIIGGFSEVAGRMAQFDPTKPNPGAGRTPGRRWISPTNWT